MKVLIVEDEIYIFKALRCILQNEFPYVEVYGPIIDLTGLEQAMLEQTKYDIIYCDIRLEDGICFSVLKSFDIVTPIIFTTSYSEYALEAFKANGIAYILKPVNRDDLRIATEKALLLKNNCSLSSLTNNKVKKETSYIHYLKAETYNGSLIINVAKVCFFTIDENNSYAIMSNEVKYRIGYTLDKLINRLDPMMFFRANRQYIINRNAIQRIQHYGNRQLSLTITSFDEIPILISKEKVGSFYQWIEQ